MRRPNAIIHMSIGGTLAGAILGAIYAMMIYSFLILNGGLSSNDTILDLLSQFSFAGLFGGGLGVVPGFVLGFLSGFAMDWLVRRMEQPTTAETLAQFRRQTSLIVLILAGFGAVMAFNILLRFPLFLSFDFFLILVPAFISFLAALWVANRYVKRLSAWAASSGGKGKRSA